MLITLNFILMELVVVVTCNEYLGKIGCWKVWRNGVGLSAQTMDEWIKKAKRNEYRVFVFEGIESVKSGYESRWRFFYPDTVYRHLANFLEYYGRHS